MSDMFLSKDELTELTGYKRHSAQKEALTQLGIMHRERPDGCLLVLRSHIINSFGGKHVEAVLQRRIEPNWSGVNA